MSYTVEYVLSMNLILHWMKPVDRHLHQDKGD